MFWHSSLLPATKKSFVIPFFGSGWDIDNVSGSDFIDNLRLVFNNNRPVEPVTELIPMHDVFTEPATGGIVVDGNVIAVFPEGTNRLTLINVLLTGSAAVGRDTGDAIGGGRLGGVLSNTSEIYATPATNSSILKVSNYAGLGPGSYTTFGSFGAGVNKWIGAVRAQNGKIYCIPFNASNVLVIDPTNDTTATIGSLSSGGQKWRGGCLSPINGKIYGMPYDSDTVLVINPATDTVSTIGPIPSVGVTTARFAGCAMSTDGKLYGIPYNASSVLSIDTSTDSLSVFGSLGVDAGKWEGGALAIDGKIYAAPYNSTSILVIDPFSETTSTFGSFASGGGKWRNPVLGRDGKIYMLPANIANDLLVVGQGGYNMTRNITQSRYLNKF
jgi:hypothetical protein